jgi:type IX secretion system PorP/SprF family membrane protein
MRTKPKTMKLKACCILLFTFFSVYTKTIAQDIVFAQWQSNLISLNPAYTGIGITPQLHGVNRMNFSSFTGTDIFYMRTSALQYDQRISRKAGCIGISYINDFTGGIALGNQGIYLHYAKDFIRDGDFHLRGGLSIGAIQHSIKGSNMWYDDIQDPRTGTIFEHYRGFPEGRVFTSFAPNFNAGISASFKNIYGGFAVNNFIQPIYSFAGNPTTFLLRRYAANVGAFLPFLSKNIVFNPFMVFQKQAMFTELTTGFNVNRGIFTGGIAYKLADPNANAINLLLGISKGRIKASYSLDYAPKAIFANTTHEINLSFYFGKPVIEAEPRLAYYFRNMGF